jgi:hypothetical protein
VPAYGYRWYTTVSLRPDGLSLVDLAELRDVRLARMQEALGGAVRAAGGRELVSVFHYAAAGKQDGASAHHHLQQVLESSFPTIR